MAAQSYCTSFSDYKSSLNSSALAIPFRPIELRQDHRLAELTVIDHVGCHLVVSVEPHRESGQQSLVLSDVEIVRALDRISDVNPGPIGRIGKQGDVGLRRLRLIGRRKYRA